MNKDSSLNKPDLNVAPDSAKEQSTSDKQPNKEADIHKDLNKNKTYKAEHLPLGNGYQVKELPTEVIKVEITLTEEIIPDLVKKGDLLKKFDEPIPAPEDEFYDFDKDIYGDGTEFQP